MIPHPHQFVNKRSFDLGDNMGIPQERREEMAKYLDDMSNGFGERLQLVPMYRIVQLMENFCNTQEEFLWCYTNHIAWLYRTGRVYNMVRPILK